MHPGENRNIKPENMKIAMTNRVSILYTYRNPWPRRLAAAAGFGGGCALAVARGDQAHQRALGR